MAPMHHHSGHRARMRARYEKSPESFADHELLELLLFYVIPQKDTNALAHELINQFGSLSSVFEATPAQLKTVNGMGDVSSLIFPLIMDLFRRYMGEKKTLEPAPNLLEAVANRLASRYLGRTYEVVMAVGLDAGHRIVGDFQIGAGNRNSCEIDLRLLADFCCKFDPCHIVLVHNHPSGICLPSSEDYLASDMIRTFLASLKINLFDHLIFDGRGDFISFSQSNLLNPERKTDRPLYSVIIPNEEFRNADEGIEGSEETGLAVAEIMTKNQNKQNRS